MNNRDDHHEQWYTLDMENVKDVKDKDAKDIKDDIKKIEDMILRIKQMEVRQKELEKKIGEMDHQIHYLTHDNLKLINRLLEAEISLERAKNSLVRNHIPFPFSPTLLTRKFWM